MASIGRSATLLASGTVVSRILGFAKSWLLVQAIGTIGFGADAYATSTVVPNSIYALVSAGLLNAVLVPQIVRAAVADADGGRAYINKLVTLGITAFLALALIATLLTPPLMEAFGLRGEQLTLGIAFAYWSMPQIFFLGLYTLLGEVLNARKSFGPFTWAPVLNNIVGIAMLGWFIAEFGAHPGGQFTLAGWPTGKIVLLAGGATLGIAAQAIVLFFFWRRVGLRFRLDFGWRGVHLGAAGRAALWTFAMIVCTQLVGVVQTNVANSASGASASTQTLATAWLIFMLPHSVITVSVATAYYTRMAEHAHAGRIAEFRSDYASAARAISLLLGFASAAIIVCAYPIARVFTPDYQSFGNVIIAYLVGLVGFSLLFVTQRAFYALGDTRTPFRFTVVFSVIQLAGFLLSLLLPAQYRAVGIAVTVSVGQLVGMMLAGFLLRRRIGFIGARSILAAVWRAVAAAIIAMAVGILVLIPLGGAPFHAGFALSGAATALVGVLPVVAVVAVVYTLALWLLGTPDLRSLIVGIRHRTAGARRARG
ncbi:lipid II flippase MurJ [Gryllotalpicola sp.]|uniref:murein biosynthesis integral membrane protein MurJ n=1 Tax=Gryllotalpicola sp. TaxID=1932787 RepID=UPI00260FDF2A|nr:lipid II flippase MurJ [Gryllotalpicola sp.]